MSYTTRVTGQFTIEPPIRWSEIKASPFKFHHAADAHSVQSWRCSGVDLELIVDTAEQDTEDGESVITTHAGVRLVMRQIDEYRADTLVEQVQRVLDMFDDDHVFAGRLEAEGDGSYGPDVWRLEVEGGKAVKTSALTLYPDDLKDLRHEYAAGLLRLIANEIEGLPQDFELDPGRGEVKALLREKADEVAAGEGPSIV